METLIIFSDSKSEILDDVLDAAGISRDNVHYINVEKWQSLKKLELEDKMYFVRRTAKEYNTILTFGKFSAKLFGLNRLDLKKKHGVLHTTTIDGKIIPLIPTYSEEYIDKVRSNIESWALDILRAYNLSIGVVDAIGNTKMVMVDTMDKVDELIGYVKQTGVCSFDFENTEINELGVNDPDFYATTLSISFQFGSGWVIPLYHYDSMFDDSQIQEILEKLRVEVFENPNIRKIAQNLKWDAHVLEHYGIQKLRGRIDDTKLMMHIHNETEKRGLKDMVRMFFPEFAGYEDVTKSMKWDEIPLPVLAQYNATDTDLTLRLAVLLESYLQEDGRSYVLYRNLVMAAWRPLFNAEVEGMKIDVDYLNKAIEKVDAYISEKLDKLNSYKQVKRYKFAKNRDKVTERINELNTALKKRQEQSWEIAERSWKKAKEQGKVSDYYSMTKTEEKIQKELADLKTGKKAIYSEFNFGSWQQLQDLLYFSEYGFKFKSQNTSTGKDVLEQLNDTSGFIEDLLALRSMEKMQGTYLKGIRKRLVGDRIHTTYKLDGTASGRLCVSGDTLIQTDKGLEFIKDIVNKKKKVNVLTHKGNYRKVVGHYYKGREEMFLVTLESGKSIKCTKKHKFLTDKGWLSLENILSLQTEKTVKIIAYERDSI